MRVQRVRLDLRVKTIDCGDKRLPGYRSAVALHEGFKDQKLAAGKQKKPSKAVARGDGRLMRMYLVMAGWCLKHRISTIVAASLFLAASILLVPLIRTGLIPATDAGYTTIDVEMAPGTALEATTRQAEEVRKTLASVSGIKQVFAIVGISGDDQVSEVNKAELLVTLGPEEARPRQVVFEGLVRSALTDVPGATILGRLRRLGTARGTSACK